MKNPSSRVISAVALSVIVLCLLGGFSRLDPEYMAKSLLKQRISVLQDALQGRVSKQAAEEKLRQIEDEALLVQDMDFIEQLKYQDVKKQNKETKKKEDSTLLMETACLGAVGAMQQKKQYYQYTTYEAEIWPEGRGAGKAGESAVLCNLVVKKEDRTFFLTVLEPENL